MFLQMRERNRIQRPLCGNIFFVHAPLPVDNHTKIVWFVVFTTIKMFAEKYNYAC